MQKFAENIKMLINFNSFAIGQFFHINTPRFLSILTDLLSISYFFDLTIKILLFYFVEVTLFSVILVDFIVYIIYIL